MLDAFETISYALTNESVIKLSSSLRTFFDMSYLMTRMVTILTVVLCMLFATVHGIA